MQTISQVYKTIKPAIVAICSRISSNPNFPDIIGTGFIVDQSGLILTNKHVVDAIFKLPRRKNSPPEEWPAFCMLFHMVPGRGMGTVPLEMVAAAGIKKFNPGAAYYGDIPDIGFIRVNVSGLPYIHLKENFQLEEGEEIGWLFRCVISESIPVHFQPTPHESSSYSMGYKCPYPAWQGYTQRAIPSPGA